MPQEIDGTPKPDRPYMPGYGLDAATSRPGERVPWRLVSELLAGSRNYWVSTTRPDGRPHAVPVWGVWLDQVFYFSTGRGSRKARNLAHNPEIVVQVESGPAAVIIEGAAEDVTDVSDFRRFAEGCEAKYDWRPGPGEAWADWEDFFHTSAVYAARPRVAFSFSEDLAETATRWRFEGERG